MPLRTRQSQTRHVVQLGTDEGKSVPFGQSDVDMWMEFRHVLICSLSSQIPTCPCTFSECIHIYVHIHICSVGWKTFYKLLIKGATM